MSLRLRHPRPWNAPRLILAFTLLVTSLALLHPPSPPSASGPVSADIPVTISAIQSQTTLTSATTPTHILIPDINIDLPVTQAQVVNGYWQVPTDSAAYGLGSAPLGTGNTVIFAHARSGLFAPLPRAQVGQKIYVFTVSTWQAFEIISKREVVPTDTSVISTSPDAQLTLYTCAGINDSKRLVIQTKKAPL